MKGILGYIGDEYSKYYTVDEFQSTVNSTQGTFCGIGVTVKEDKETGYILIGDVLEGGSAIEAGVKAGDLVIQIDSVKIPEDMPASEGVDLMKGEAGTKFKMTVLRGTEQIEFELVRKIIPIISVDYMVAEDNIGYIYISQFTDSAASQFKKAMDALTEQGVEGLIIDVRDNPGGTLTSVLAIADYLMPEGLIMYEEDKHGERVEYRSTDADAHLTVPCVVLTNGNSASAAEVFTGALKDHKLAVIMGTKTFGKGIVQTLRMLSDGTGLKFTVKNYFTPLGNNIHGVGITPDIEIELDKELYKNEGIDNQYQAAINYFKETK